MKRYFLAITTLVVFAAVSNAQVEKKQPVNKPKPVSVTNKTPANAKKVTTSTTSNVTPSATANNQKTSATAIKRKHLHTKKPLPKKTESK
jgi:hypothetical protein